MEKQVMAAGFQCLRVTYPSMFGSMADSSEWVLSRISKSLPPGPKYLVTHSAGGILARHLADRLEFRRVLMLAPPNQGARLARVLGDRSLRALDAFCGPKGRELASPDWPEPTFDFSIIAGTSPGMVDTPQATLGRRIGAFSKHCQIDGTLHVDDTKHPDMTEFRTAQAGHTFLMDHPEVARMTVNFLKTGRLS
ncbi:MAG: hypothetical protein ACI9OJ_004076 [Myxococcota bacterium]|jgi:hypothetical protein